MIFEVLIFVVNNLVGAQTEQEIPISGGGGSNNIGSGLLSKLNRQMSHAASCCLDKHLLVRLDGQMLVNRLISRQSNNGQSRCFPERNIVGFCRNIAFIGQGIFGISAACAGKTNAAEHGIPFFKISNFFSASRNYSAGVPTDNGRYIYVLSNLIATIADFCIYRINANGLYS